MTEDWCSWLELRAAARERDGLRRTLQPRAASDHVLDLASNDYLGLSRDPRVVEAAARAARTWGAGATGSRLVTGTTMLHAALEEALAEFCAAESALVCSSGYLANLSAIGALAGPGDLVISDAANHASIVDACRLSRARVLVTPSRDVAAVRAALQDRSEPRALVVTDAAFSADGALAPVADLHRVAHEAGALLVVDEAHSLGVHGTGGRGVVHAAGLARASDIVRTVTLSKSLGSQGGAVLASRLVIDHLINTARPFIFDTGLAPPSAGAALAALDVVQAEPELPARVLECARRLAAMLDVSGQTSAVVPVVVGAADAAFAAAQACLREDVRVGCFRPPSVPPGTSRLRLTARASLSAAELERAADVVLRSVGRESRRPTGQVER